MMTCEECQGAAQRILGVVKDGKIYDGYRCEKGHQRLMPAAESHLSVSTATESGVSVARLCCGENCFIFDRRLFRHALKEVLHFARRCAKDLVVDLSQIGFVGDSLLTAVRFLDNGLFQRGHRLFVVTPSSLVAAEVRSAAPKLATRIRAKLAEALEAASAVPLANAAALA